MNVESLLNLFRERGDSQYGGECVTQLQHALQAAYLAESDDGSDELIAASLLHDVGHLLHVLPDDAPDSGIDDCHEATGYDFLCQLFPPAVTEPVRLHVPAKRYLCTIDANYLNQLSEPSRISLQLQGGLMSDEELEAFRQNAHYETALRVRGYDDQAKSPDAETPPLEHFEVYLHRVATNTAQDTSA